MTDIEIREKFIIDGLPGFDLVKLPLKYLRLKIFPIQPYLVEAFTSWQEEKNE